MPERFYDPEFVQRVVRLLQLKGGRAPSEVADEIVPVLDLSQLFSRAAEELPGELFPPLHGRVFAGQAFSRYYGPNIAAVAGSVHVSQLFNPVGSNRLLLVINIMHTGGVGNAQLSGRFLSQALATLSARTGINSRRGAAAPVHQFRFEVFTNAAFLALPGLSGVMFHTVSTTSFPLIPAGMAAVVPPGEGFLVHASDGGGADADPAPTAGVVAFIGQTIEVPIA